MPHPLRLAYDATPLLGTRTGVGTMVARVLERLMRPDVDVTAYATTWRGRGALPGVVPDGVRCVRWPLPARPLHLAWRHADVPRIEWFTGAVDVVHGGNFVVPPARAARVVTVHDLTALHHPELCNAHTRTYPSAIRRALRSGAWVHTVSDFVRSEILDAFDADPDRVVTVPNGVDAIPQADGERGRARAGADAYLLALGTIEPRKNYPALVRAFDAVAGDLPDVRLVIAGPDGWDEGAFARAVAGARHADRIVRLGATDEVARAELLRGARALVYPSIYEGFGLPPLEAMSVGLPVLASDTGAVREVVDGAAMLFPTGDEHALREGIVRISTDEARRTDLSRRGPVVAARYGWDRTADGLVALYRRATVGS